MYTQPTVISHTPYSTHEDLCEWIGEGGQGGTVVVAHDAAPHLQAVQILPVVHAGIRILHDKRASVSVSRRCYCGSGNLCWLGLLRTDVCTNKRRACFKCVCVACSASDMPPTHLLPRGHGPPQMDGQLPHIHKHVRVRGVRVQAADLHHTVLHKCERRLALRSGELGVLGVHHVQSLYMR